MSRRGKRLGRGAWVGGFDMDLEFLINGFRRTVSLETKDGRYHIRRNGVVLEADVRSLEDGNLSVLIDGRSYLASVAEADGRVLVAVGGDSFVLEQAPLQEPQAGEEQPAESDDRAGGLVRAPMPGRLIKVSVVEGESVRRNQTLAVVEAMKMENEIKSPRDATVKKIFAAVGEIVDTDKPLVELEA